MNNKNSGVIVGVVAACLGMLLLLLLLLGAGSKGSGDAVATGYAGGGCDQAASINSALIGRGFTSDQYNVGQVNWAEPEANERGSSSFKSDTPQSAEALVAWLGDGSPQAQAAYDNVAAQAGVSRKQLLNPGNWVPVQFTTPFELPGNTAYSNGQVNDAGVRRSDAGDIIWFFVSTKNCDVPPVVVRAGCGNPQNDLPRPIPVPNPTTTTRVCGNLCKGPDLQPAPCVDNAGVRCDGIPGSGGQPGTGGATDHGDDGYSPSDPPPPTVVTTAPPPTTAVTLPPTTTPPTTSITAPPG